METMTQGGFNKLLTSSKRNRNNGLKCTEQALAAKDPEDKERYTEMAGLYFGAAREIDERLKEYAEAKAKESEV